MGEFMVYQYWGSYDNQVTVKGSFQKKGAKEIIPIYVSYLEYRCFLGIDP